jgi:5-methylcytosine-specific restriction endonuclease McrA
MGKKYIEIGSLEGGILAIERFPVEDDLVDYYKPRFSKDDRADRRKYAWASCKKYFKFRCAYCLKKSEYLTKDHFIPRSKGGGAGTKNIVPCCEECNLKKDNSHPKNWCNKDQLRRIYNYFRQFGSTKKFH